MFLFYSKEKKKILIYLYQKSIWDSFKYAYHWNQAMRALRIQATIKYTDIYLCT